MRILHVATLFTPDGSYGGPTRVALNLCRELACRGHSVVLAGASSGYRGTPPDEIDGVACEFHPARQLIPGLGFAGMTSPRMLQRLVPTIGEYDLVHVHLSREFVTLPIAVTAMLRGVPYVLQTHGMIDRSSRTLAAPLDLALTRPALRNANRVLYLTKTEQRELEQFARCDLSVTRLRNGVPDYGRLAMTPRSEGALPEVLYLARLHPRKRPDVFARVAKRLLDQGVRAKFTLVGPVGEAAAAVRAVIATSSNEITYEGPVAPDAAPARLARSSVYVLPSIDEPYPMSVLEAMSVGRPVIVTSSCGLADDIKRTECGLVVDESETALERAILHYLENPSAAEAAGRAGREAAEKYFSIKTIGDELEQIYTTVLSCGVSVDKAQICD